MFGAVQFGVLAACIVLFVPMGMAGWHLSRNKVLFFSGALFITLAVGVHLTPYFPSFSDFVSSVSSTVDLENRDSCISFLHDITYDVKPVHSLESLNSSSSHYEVSWGWAKSTPVIACEFQKLDRSDVSDLLNGSWVVLAGDSQARFVALSLLTLILDSDNLELVRDDLFKRHSNYQIVISEIGMKLDFIWAPYVTNLTDLMMEFKQNRSYPDVMVMGSGLWHMLHVTNSSDYGVSLQELRSAVASVVPFSSEFAMDGPATGSAPVRSPHLFWLGMPMLINSMLNSEEKKEKMSAELCDAYDKEVYKSKLVHQFGGPLLLLDIQSLSRNCGSRCTLDGMHYDGAVYETAVHIVLNALLIESQQKV